MDNDVVRPEFDTRIHLYASLNVRAKGYWTHLCSFFLLWRGVCGRVVVLFGCWEGCSDTCIWYLATACQMDESECQGVIRHIRCARGGGDLYK